MLTLVVNGCARCTGIVRRMTMATVWRARKKIAAVPTSARVRACVFYDKAAVGEVVQKTVAPLCGVANRGFVVIRRQRVRRVWFAITRIVPVRCGASAVVHARLWAANALCRALPTAKIPKCAVNMGAVL